MVIAGVFRARVRVVLVTARRWMVSGTAYNLCGACTVQGLAYLTSVCMPGNLP